LEVKHYLFLFIHFSKIGLITSASFYQIPYFSSLRQEASSVINALKLAASERVSLKQTKRMVVDFTCRRSGEKVIGTSILNLQHMKRVSMKMKKKTYDLDCNVEYLQENWFWTRRWSMRPAISVNINYKKKNCVSRKEYIVGNNRESKFSY